MQALLYYDPMGGENMPALSALLNYIGMYIDRIIIDRVYFANFQQIGPV